ncbi:MAG: hypothetical protein JW783_00015 [Bacteroidales bacterium]|nr:hypothetical protein [Bacteroidales bacterium]MBN2748714.1 hypothetical protein [Bacteroidales bacterium]
MRKNCWAIVMVLVVLVSAGEASAQINQLLKKKAWEKVNKALEEEEKKESVEEEQVEEEQPQKQSKQRTNPADAYMQKHMMASLGLNANIPHDKSYSFTSSMSMNISNFFAESKEQNDVLYTVHFDKSTKNFALVFDGKDKETGEKQKSTMIFDMKNGAMLILSDNGQERSGMVMAMAKDSVDAAPEAEEPTQMTDEEAKAQMEALSYYYKKTGKNKTVAGVKCEEFTHSDSLGTVEIWAAPQKLIDYSSAYSHMGGMQFLATGGLAYGLGMIMEMHFKDAKTNDRTDLVVNEIKENSPSSLDINSYQVMGFGAPPAEQ